MKGIQTQCCNHPETVSETVFLVLISLYTYLAILDDSLLDLTSVVRILSQTIVIIGIILFFYRNHGLPPIRISLWAVKSFRRSSPLILL